METYAEDCRRIVPSLLSGLTPDGKIALKDLQEIYDSALASQLIPTPVPVPKVMDYTLIDEVLKERK